MTRLCLLTDSAVPSGVGSHLLTLAAGLDRATVIVAARPGTGLLERAAAAGFAVKAIGDDEAALARWFARAAPDLVHVHAGIGWEGHGATRAARAAGVPVVRTEHLPYLLTDAGQQAEHRESVAGVARLICVSDAVAESHRAAGVDAALISTVRNGVASAATTRPRAALRAEWGVDTAPVLLMAARFTAQKGHALLLDALPRILAARPDTVALLAGTGPLLVGIARAVAARGLAGCVRMLGERADLAELMALADLLVLPSAFEGLPLVALEAMAAGLPVVATAAPGTAEAVEDGVTGRLATPDAAGLAEAVLAVLADPEAAAGMGEAGRERQRALFSAERMIDETRAVQAAAARHGGEARMRTRIGFIGAGGIANRHFGVLEQFEDAAIVAVADVDLGRATETAARFGARAFADAAAMLDAVRAGRAVHLRAALRPWRTRAPRIGPPPAVLRREADRARPRHRRGRGRRGRAARPGHRGRLPLALPGYAGRGAGAAGRHPGAADDRILARLHPAAPVVVAAGRVGRADAGAGDSPR